MKTISTLSLLIILFLNSCDLISEIHIMNNLDVPVKIVVETLMSSPVTQVLQPNEQILIIVNSLKSDLYSKETFFYRIKYIEIQTLDKKLTLKKGNHSAMI